MNRTKVLFTNILGFILGALGFVGVAYGMNFVMELLDGVPNLFVSGTAQTVKYVLDVVFIAAAASYVAYLLASGIAKPMSRRMRPAVMLIGVCLIAAAALMFIAPAAAPFSKLSPIFDEIWSKLAVGLIGVFSLIDGFPVRKKYKTPQVAESSSSEVPVFKADEKK